MVMEDLSLNKWTFDIYLPCSILYRYYLRNPFVRRHEFPTIDTLNAWKAEEEEEVVEEKEGEVREKAKEVRIVHNDLLKPNPDM